jgi:hypothetical protein
MMPSHTGKNFTSCNPKLELEPGVVLSSDLQDDLYINPANLQEEFLKQPELYAWWASTCELAKDLVARQKFLLERLSATIDHRVRLEAQQESERLGKTVKMTETMVEHTVISSEEYQKAMLCYLDFKKQLGMLQAGKEAMEQRKDMLISLGANYRAEASSNPSILMDAARERARRAAAGKRMEENSEPEVPRKTPVGKK